MTSRLFVGNLSPKATEHELQELFTEVGTVQYVIIARDRLSGSTKDYGFIEMDSIESARAAVTSIAGRLLHNRPLKVTEILEPGERNPAYEEQRAEAALRPPRRGWGSIQH